jgi:hypothetical protein
VRGATNRRLEVVDHPKDDLETELVDLTSTPLSTLRDCDSRLLDASRSKVLEQVDRPRVNLGDSPPGRVD